MITYSGLVILCFFILMSPDSVLIGSLNDINIPIVGNLSFSVFVIVVAIVLIVIRIILKVYLDQWHIVDIIIDKRIKPGIVSPLTHFPLNIISFSIIHLMLPMFLIFMAWRVSFWPEISGGLILLTFMFAVGPMFFMLVDKLHDKYSSLAAGILTVMIINVGGISLLSLSIFVSLMVFPDRNLNLSYVDLRGKDLRFTKLDGAILTGANLKNANLNGLDLSGIHMQGADLTGAKLRFTILKRADIRDAKLKGADLYSADMSYVKMARADMEDANLDNALLANVSLSKANFRNASFRETRINKSNFEEAIGLTQSQVSQTCFTYRDPTHKKIKNRGDIPAYEPIGIKIFIAPGLYIPKENYRCSIESFYLQ